MSRILAIVLLVASSLAWADGDRTPPLVDANWLEANLERDNLVVLDVRSGIDNGAIAAVFRTPISPGLFTAATPVMAGARVGTASGACCRLSQAWSA